MTTYSTWNIFKETWPDKSQIYLQFHGSKGGRERERADRREKTLEKDWDRLACTNTPPPLMLFLLQKPSPASLQNLGIAPERS